MYGHASAKYKKMGRQVAIDSPTHYLFSPCRRPMGIVLLTHDHGGATCRNHKHGATLPHGLIVEVDTHDGIGA